MRMLIGYASRFGSTRDIAIRIADAVRTHGNEVDVRSVDQISDVDDQCCVRTVHAGAAVNRLSPRPAVRPAVSLRVCPRTQRPP